MSPSHEKLMSPRPRRLALGQAPATAPEPAPEPAPAPKGATDEAFSRLCTTAGECVVALGRIRQEAVRVTAAMHAAAVQEIHIREPPPRLVGLRQEASKLFDRLCTLTAAVPPPPPPPAAAAADRGAAAAATEEEQVSAAAEEVASQARAAARAAGGPDEIAARSHASVHETTAVAAAEALATALPPATALAIAALGTTLMTAGVTTGSQPTGTGSQPAVEGFAPPPPMPFVPPSTLMSVELGALADGTAFRQQAADSLLLGVLAQLMQCQRELGVAREELASEIARAKAARPSAGRDSECEREHSEPPPPAVANVAVVLIDEEARALLPGILMVPALPRSDPSFGGVGAGTALRSLWGASELPSLPIAGRELTSRQLAGDGSAASVQSSGGGEAEDGAEWPMPSIYLHSPKRESSQEFFS
jgi:hypothetical protein